MIESLKKIFRNNKHSQHFYFKCYEFRYSIRNICDVILQRQFDYILKKVTFEKALDAGCGLGRYCFRLATQFPNVQIYGCDFPALDRNRGKIAYCKEKVKKLALPNLHFFEQDLKLLRGGHNYDFIFCIEVLEHIPNNRSVIHNFKICLKGGGFLYLEMPGTPYHRKMLPKRFLKPLDEVERLEHVGEQYSLDQLESILRECGLQIIESGYVMGPLGEFAYQLDVLLHQYFFLGRVMLLPLTRILAIVDFYMRRFWRRGHIWILAQKKHANHHPLEVNTQSHEPNLESHEPQAILSNHKCS